MFFNFLFLNLINFEYEINFIKDLWIYHFAEFCLLLTLEDIFFILFIFYILIICITNLSYLINKINWKVFLISPIKLLIDFITIYLFLKIIFLFFIFIDIHNINFIFI